MSDNGSISSKNAIIHLQKLIGIEPRNDFVEPNFCHDAVGRIHSNALIMSKYAEEALNQIKCQLGYLPRRDVTFPNEWAIRQLLFEYDQDGNIDKLFDSCNPHMDEIYKRDMQPHDIDDYPEEIYSQYHSLFLEFNGTVRARIIKLLGYEPRLKQSIYAELLMRCRIADSAIIFSDQKNEADYEVQAIIRYRVNCRTK